MIFNKNHYSDNMQKTLDVLTKDLSGVRTGRASAGLLDPVFVDIYGQKMRLVQVATISVFDNSTLNVAPYDTSSLQSIEKGINEANLGLSVSSNGNSILAKIPKMTEETRTEWLKVVKKIVEATKVAIRNIRRDGMDDIKKREKDKEISEDEKKKHELELQKITDDFIGKIDQMFIKKEKEIIEI